MLIKKFFKKFEKMDYIDPVNKEQLFQTVNVN
jgi:hypothetical protein